MALCVIEGCTNEARYNSGTWCNPHWQRWKRNGDPLIWRGKIEPLLEPRHGCIKCGIKIYREDHCYQCWKQWNGRPVCTVDGCDNFIHAGSSKDRMWCSKHQARWRDFGTPTPKNTLMRWCPKCRKRQYRISAGHGMCNRCWKGLNVNPRPNYEVFGGDLRERVLARTTKESEDGCWIWQGFVSKENKRIYDQSINRKGGDRVSRDPRRLLYQEFIGPTPDKTILRVKCEQHLCINPHHVFWWDRDTMVNAGFEWIAKHGEPPKLEQWNIATVDRPNTTLIKDTFGTWNSFIGELGFAPRQPVARNQSELYFIDPILLDTVEAEEMTVMEAVEEIGCSRNTIYRRLWRRQAGLPDML